MAVNFKIINLPAGANSWDIWYGPVGLNLTQYPHSAAPADTITINSIIFDGSANLFLEFDAYVNQPGTQNPSGQMAYGDKYLAIADGTSWTYNFATNTLTQTDGGGGQGTVTNPTISFNNPSFVGDYLIVTINFTYQGPAADLPFTIQVGQLPSDIMTTYVGDQPVSARASPTPLSAVAAIAITSATGYGGQPYDIAASIGGVNCPTLYDQVKVLSLAASYSGGTLTYSFTGFHGGSTVTLQVNGEAGSTTKTADSKGNGSGSFIDNDPAGEYTLMATDNSGWQAIVGFTVSGVPANQQVSGITIGIISIS